MLDLCRMDKDTGRRWNANNNRHYLLIYEYNLAQQ